MGCGIYIAALSACVVSASAATACRILRAGRGEQGSFQYLLVLGCKVEGDQPSSVLADRIRAAGEFLLAHKDVTAIVSGGKGSERNLSEARCIYNGLTAMSILPERIWMEDKAVSTVENFTRSAALLREKTGALPQVIGVLSSEVHLLRAGMIAKKQGIAIVPIPARTEKRWAFLKALLREIPLVWYYRLAG